ncbi:hypothetical protein CKF54_02845, partial [Psittacicella hinzii]
AFATRAAGLNLSIQNIKTLLSEDNQKSFKAIEHLLYSCRSKWLEFCKETGTDVRSTQQCNEFFQLYDDSTYNKKSLRGRKSKYELFISDYPELRKEYEKLIKRLIDKKQPEGRVIQEIESFLEHHKITNVSKYLPSSPKTIYNWAKSGLIPKRITNEKKHKTGQVKEYDKKKKPGEYRTIDQRAIDFPNLENEFGHFELDTLVGAGRESYRLSLMERNSRYHIYTPLTSMKAGYVAQEIIREVRRIARNAGKKPEEVVKSITCDNGIEFSDYKTIERTLGIKVYFCKVGRPDQRARQECSHKIYRRYFYPKKKPAKFASRSTCLYQSRFCNNIARKVLNYRTPSEVFNEYIASL